MHDKRELLRILAFCEAAATDGRNFVKKGVSWALRTIGVRNQTMHDAAIEIATRLVTSGESRWVGKDVLRDLQRTLVAKKLAKITSRQTSSRPARRIAAAPRPRPPAR